MLPWMIDAVLCRGRCVACVSGEDPGEREESSDRKGQAGAVSKSFIHLEKSQYRPAENDVSRRCWIGGVGQLVGGGTERILARKRRVATWIAGIVMGREDGTASDRRARHAGAEDESAWRSERVMTDDARVMVLTDRRVGDRGVSDEPVSADAETCQRAMTQAAVSRSVMREEALRE